jgi:hypothetical protein
MKARAPSTRSNWHLKRPGIMRGSPTCFLAYVVTAFQGSFAQIPSLSVESGTTEMTCWRRFGGTGVPPAILALVSRRQPASGTPALLNPRQQVTSGRNPKPSSIWRDISGLERRLSEKFQTLFRLRWLRRSGLFSGNGSMTSSTGIFIGISPGVPLGGTDGGTKLSGRMSRFRK